MVKLADEDSDGVVDGVNACSGLCTFLRSRVSSDQEFVDVYTLLQY